MEQRPDSPKLLPGSQEAPKYVEPSQPPEGTKHSISDIPTVVGGKAVRKHAKAPAQIKSPTSKPVAESFSSSPPRKETDKAKPFSSSSQVKGKEEASPDAKARAERPGSGSKGRLNEAPSDKSLSMHSNQADEEGEALTALSPSPLVSRQARLQLACKC